MSTSITISLDTRRAKKDGSYPIVLRLGHNQRTLSINLRLSVGKSDWDSKASRVKRSYKGVFSVDRLNNELLNFHAVGSKEVARLRKKGELNDCSIPELKQKILAKLFPKSAPSPSTNKSLGLVAFTKIMVDELTEANRVGNARTYHFAVSALMRLIGMKEISFKAVDYNLIVQLEKRHLAKGNTYNSLSVYLRTLRAIYNEAIRRGLAKKKYYPFDSYKIKSQPTKKRAIPLTQVLQVINANLTDSPHLQNAQRIFTLCYGLRGMNYTDLALLRVSDYRNGRIQYTRAKTGQEFNIKVPKGIEPILLEQIEGKSGKDYLMEIVKRNSSLEIAKDIEWARKRYNRDLKKLGKSLGIEAPLTSYVVRHSFATIAKNGDIPIEDISQLLGHKSIKTTQIYLDSLSDEKLDDKVDSVLGL